MATMMDKPNPIYRVVPLASGIWPSSSQITPDDLALERTC